MTVDDRTPRSLSLTTGGITLLGVMLSIGISVGFGIAGPWWVRLLAGAATTVLLALAVKFGTAAGHGPLARAANWMIGPGEEAGGDPAKDDGASEGPVGGESSGGTDRPEAPANR